MKRRSPLPQAARQAPRLLGGSRRGFALQTRPNEETRPTAVRARKALFDALTHRASLLADFAAEKKVAQKVAQKVTQKVTEDSVWLLDAFAGSGALGLEALSRWQKVDEEVDEEDNEKDNGRGGEVGDKGGCEKCGVFFEHNPAAASTLRDNIERSGFPAYVLCRDAFAPHAAREPFERGKIRLAFFDPPYAMSREKAIRSPAAFAAQGWFAEGALVVFQRAATREPLLSLGEDFAPLGTLLSSSTCFFFFRYR